MKRTISALLCALLCLLPTLAGAVTFTDALDREVTVEAPTRVVAMIGSFADLWCVAGGRDTLVGCANDSWTEFGLELDDSVVNIGSSKSPSVEAIFACEPDLVLASTKTGADLELRETFESAGINVAYFDVSSFDDYLAMLRVCTEITGREDCYETYGTRLQADIMTAIGRADGSAPTVLYIRASGSSVKVKGSEGNVLGEMLRDLGCVNIADSESGLLEALNPETIIACDPQYIFVVTQGADPTAARQLLESTVLSNPAWDGLTAVKEGRVYTMEDRLYNVKPNALWGIAYEQLADILYPEEA